MADKVSLLRRRHSVSEMRIKLLDTGLDSAEVEAALGAAVAVEAPAPPPNTKYLGFAGLRNMKRSNSTYTVQEVDKEAQLVDPVELLDLVEESHGSGGAAMSKLSRLQSNAATWVERCEALLEEKDEADYVAKKQLAAQVRAFLANSDRFGYKDIPSDDDSLDDQDGQTEWSSEGSSAVEWGRKQSRPPTVGTSMSSSAVASPLNAEKKSAATICGISPNQLFEQLLAGKTKLTRKYVRTVLDRFIDAWTKKYGDRMSLLRDYEVPAGGKMVVVGDVHGQLPDVLTILLHHGEPSSTTRYVFNGDIADRGPNGAEIFILLFAYFLEDPNCLIINRGNHEDDEMNRLPLEEGGGFQKEVLDKYGHCPFMRFVQIFKMLPLATVIADEVLIVHGGLARNARTTLSLDYIEAIDASQICCPPGNTAVLKEQVFSDLLWSDPTEKLGCAPSPRGAGQLWGPDLTRAFLKRTGLKWIIRSHQPPRERRGWCEHHLGLVFTVFSASNYQGTGENKGAVAVLELPCTVPSRPPSPNKGSPVRPRSPVAAHDIDLAKSTSSHSPASSPRVSAGTDGILNVHPGKLDMQRPELQVRFYEFYAPSAEQLAEISRLPSSEARCKALSEAGAAKARHDHVVVGERRERLVLNRMAGRVVELRPDLWEAFIEADAKRTGIISFDCWCETLASICGDHFPWILAAEKWNLTTKKKGFSDLCVDYRSFLGRFQVGLSQEQWVGWKALMMRDVYEACMRRDEKLQESLNMFDKDGDGKVAVSEFLEVLTAEVGRGGKGGPTRAQLLALARGLFPQFQYEEAEQIQEAQIDVHAFFERFTVVYHQTLGMLSVDPLAEWRPVLGKIGKLLLAHDKTKPRTRPTSATGVSSTTSAQFRRRASVHQRREGHIGRVLDRLFSSLDDNGDGYLQVDEFVTNMQAIPGLDSIQHKGEPLGPALLKELGEALDAMSGDRTGRVNFIQFLEAFAVGVATATTRENKEGDKATSPRDNVNGESTHKPIVHMDAEKAEMASIEHILSVLYRHRHTLWCGCTAKDPTFTGRVLEEDFAAVLAGTDMALAQAERQFSETQITMLAHHLAEEDGKVPYVEFIQALVVRDAVEAQEKGLRRSKSEDRASSSLRRSWRDGRQSPQASESGRSSTRLNSVREEESIVTISRSSSKASNK